MVSKIPLQSNLLRLLFIIYALERLRVNGFSPKIQQRGSDLLKRRDSLEVRAASPVQDWAEKTGESALWQVQELASQVVAASNDNVKPVKRRAVSKTDSKSVDGIGGVLFNNVKYNSGVNGGETETESDSRPGLTVSPTTRREEEVWTALANLELDMQLLDTLAGQKPQLTTLEFSLLTMSVFAAGSGPFILGGHLASAIAPSAAAFSAAIGIGAEYLGRVAVADGKEIAAATIQCAAEAEGFLANAERAKAVTPLCVGVSACAATSALLVPALIDTLPIQVATEIFLFCPVVSVLAAAVASLALQETKLFSKRATSIGNRRFAKSGLVGRTWLSTSEQISLKSRLGRSRWKTFCLSVLPAPIIGAIVPGVSLGSRAIIVAALAAAESAYFLAECEYVLARATDAVAVKARSAAVCDTYANQGARSSAILPFTSALSGLCAAATAAIVELPFLETLSAAGTISGLFSQMLVLALFPAASATFAAAASVSKARCEVQAEAASQAATTLALEVVGDDDDDPILRPFRGVWGLVKLTYASSIIEPLQRLIRRLRVVPFRVTRLPKLWRRWTRLNDSDETRALPQS